MNKKIYRELNILKNNLARMYIITVSENSTMKKVENFRNAASPDYLIVFIHTKFAHTHILKIRSTKRIFKIVK